MTIANRINVAYPIVLVLGGMAIGYLPGVPTFPLPPDLVLLVFLPPLLYWESVTAPTSEFRAGAFWIFQMAFGLVIVTTLTVAAVAHGVIPGMGWGVAFVLGAIVSSTDEVAFAAIADQLNVPRHLIGTIEGESLVNDATSLILYAIGIAAVVGASFSLLHAAGELVLTIVESVLIGLASAVIALSGLARHQRRNAASDDLGRRSFYRLSPGVLRRRVGRAGDGNRRSRRQPLVAARCCSRGRGRC